eukprot:12111874-Alexandrium_andersonii.AAC.1
MSASLVGSEMCIRDSAPDLSGAHGLIQVAQVGHEDHAALGASAQHAWCHIRHTPSCLQRRLRLCGSRDGAACPAPPAHRDPRAVPRLR